MPEDVRPDPVFDKLGRFTPDAGGIDRDEWLFQAGRASARAGRAWKWLAGALAVTQAVTLAAWATRGPTPIPAPPPVAIEPDPLPAEPSDPPPDSYLVYTRAAFADSPPGRLAPMQLPPTKPLTWGAGRSADLE